MPCRAIIFLANMFSGHAVPSFSVPRCSGPGGAMNLRVPGSVLCQGVPAMWGFRSNASLQCTLRLDAMGKGVERVGSRGCISRWRLWKRGGISWWSLPIVPSRVDSSKGPNRVKRANWPTKENKQLFYYFFRSMETIAWDGPKWDRRIFSY